MDVLARRALALMVFAPLAGCHDDHKAAPGPEKSADDTDAIVLQLPQGLDEHLADFVPVVLEADLSSLNETERTVLDELIAASRPIERVFERQANRLNAAYRRALAAIPGPRGRTALRLFEIHAGVYERHRGFAAFVLGVPPRPKGGGFYPADLTREQWSAFLEQHPDREAELISLTTLVERRGDDLVGIPYSKAFRAELDKSIEHLHRAVRSSQNTSLCNYLAQLAEALATDRYQKAEIAWMDVDSPVELTLGPYEIYEDELFGYKASFEAFVTVVDRAASRHLEKLRALLPEMEDHLPIPDEHKNHARDASSPVRVAKLVFSAGEARAGIQTAAFNLPNDEMVRELKGSKKVLLTNLIDAKFAQTLVPIARDVLADEQAAELDAAAFRDHILLHEMSHGLGPGRIVRDGQTAEVREFLLETYPAIEEAKADLCGLWNLLYLTRRQIFTHAPRRIIATYLAGLFRSVRFGTGSAHGRAAAIEFNLLRDTGAIRIDPHDGRARYQGSRFEKALGEVTRHLLMIEATGDYAAAKRLIQTQGRTSKEMQNLISRLVDQPTDLRPIFPLAGESVREAQVAR